MVCLSRRYRSGNVTLCVPHEAFFRFNLNIGGKYFSRHLTLVGTRPLVHVPWSTSPGPRTHARTHACTMSLYGLRTLYHRVCHVFVQSLL
jgi:hypothetical protein